MNMNILTAAVLSSGLALCANSANAGMTTDNHGNVGYDSYDECVTAVKEGSAKFYTPYTYQTQCAVLGRTVSKQCFYQKS